MMMMIMTMRMETVITMIITGMITTLSSFTLIKLFPRSNLLQRMAGFLHENNRRPDSLDRRREKPRYPRNFGLLNRILPQNPFPLLLLSKEICIKHPQTRLPFQNVFSQIKVPTNENANFHIYPQIK